MGNLLVCERPSQNGKWFSNWFYRGKRVEVNVDAGTVNFANCHRARRFWAVRKDASYTCRLSELLAVHVYREPEYGGSLCSVSTPAGRAVFGSFMNGFDEVVTVLRRYAESGGGPMAENPKLWDVAVFALALLVMVVLFVLVWLGWL